MREDSILTAPPERLSTPPPTVVVAVVVTYHPDWDALASCIAHLRRQVETILIVDNGSCPEADPKPGALPATGIHWLPLGANLGIAKAQNLGIERARAIGATHVLLLDQDSQPKSDMVARLLEAAEALRTGGARLAAIAPIYVDERREKLAPFVRFRGLKVERSDCTGEEAVVATDAAIASGSLIPLETLADVGGMREELFIDWVDIEWCLRARSLGYQSYGVCQAVLRHSLGTKPRKFLGREITHHDPLRSYYFFRNAVWLFGQKYMPIAWKLAVAGQLLRRGLFYPVAVAPRLGYLRMMTLGILHGLRGRLGPLDADA